MMPNGQPWLLVIFGPQAVGKMTVGQEIARLTGASLLYNHMVTDLLTEFFPFGSPSFERLWVQFIDGIMEERVAAGEPLIVTIGWDQDSEHAAGVVEGWRTLLAQQGGAVYFAELQAPLEVRLERNRHEHRRSHKKVDWATDEALTVLSRDHRLASDDMFPYPDQHIRIENSSMAPDEAARRIVERFALGSGEGYPAG